MPEDIIANLVLTLQQHPVLALFFVFLIAFSESLIIVGLIVPGAILMILFGALISMDALKFWPTVLTSFSGAVLGDSLSYWLGMKYQSKLHHLWPLSRHPQLISRANHFFALHGSKSIILSRFIGPLRPLIPAIAGMTKMPLKTFIIANVSSAIIWAPLYLLPGILFGLSLEIASEFASKFIFLIIALIIFIVISLWIIQRFYIFANPYIEKMIIILLNWGKQHPIAGEIPAAIFNRQHPELRGLSLVAFIIFSLTVLISLLQSTPLASFNPVSYDFDAINQFVYYSLQTFRSPPLDKVMLWLNYLTSSYFIALLCFTIGIYLFLKQNIFSLIHWLAAIALPLTLSPFLNTGLTSSLQNQLSINIESLPSFAIISSYGFLAIILSSGLSSNRQKLIYYIASLLVMFMMLAQLYYASQVASQILYGLFVGLMWFNLLGIAYRRHITHSISNKSRKEIMLLIIVLLAYPGWKTWRQDKIYLPDKNYFLMGTNGWIESGWKLLPILRQGVYPIRNNLFNIQWRGAEKNIQSQLLQLGFKRNLNSLTKLPNWFLDDIKINNLPILPHIHNGKYETLRFYYFNKNTPELTVIRLWPSQYKLKQDDLAQPLWYGSVSLLKIKKHLRISYLTTTNITIDKINLNTKKLLIYKKIFFNTIENREQTIFLLK